MSENEAEAILPAKGISLEDAESVFEVWILAGQAEFKNNTIKLGEDLCAGNQKGAASRPAFSDIEVEILTTMRGNGCRMTEKEADELLPELGILKADTREIMNRWLKTEIVSLEGSEAVLAKDLCTAHGVDQDNIQARTAAFVGIIEANGCAMTEKMARFILPEAGLEKDEVRDIVARLKQSDRVEVKDDILTLISDHCAP